MSGDQQANEERPCLHCLIVELIDDFFAENPVTPNEQNVIDTDELITAVAKTVAELTSSRGGAVRQSMIEQLMREIMKYDTEFRRRRRDGCTQPRCTALAYSRRCSTIFFYPVVVLGSRLAITLRQAKALQNSARLVPFDLSGDSV